MPADDANEAGDSALQPSRGGTTIHVKVVPGASRTRLVGRLGDAVKVQLAAPPEQGKANRALCELFAKLLGVSRQDVSLEVGASSQRKQVFVAGLSPSVVAERLKLS